MTRFRAPCLQAASRLYLPMIDGDVEVLGSEIVFLRLWETLPPRQVLRERFLRKWSPYVFGDDELLEVDLTVRDGRADIATVYVFLTGDGLEVSGWSTGDYED